jgi:hypothetical protein
VSALTVTASVRRLPESPTERIAQLERQVAELKYELTGRRVELIELVTCIEALDALLPLLDGTLREQVGRIANKAREAL